MLYFIGAGPGDPELITVKGKKLLEQADVIIYAGSLVNPKLLEYAKKEVQIHNSAYLNLDEVIKIIEDNHAEDKIIVRLHTGDPSIYGAIKEQMDRLDIINIPYKVVPGVSSFFGAAAALNLEFTLPNVSQTIILTRAPGRTPVPEKESIKSLAKHQATMVMFLSLSLIKQLCLDLQEGGYAKDTPAAIVYKATWPEEKVFRTTVENLEKTAIDNNITKTALIIVGNTLDSDYELSKLYDKNFTTEFRKGLNEN
ncbi:precorrin-4 C(11)-methyltransferase [Mycoplasma sp. P36-A1]|uniref:precorrin-4 C(11)-methyltransferase n=1 Tax=Mycoplasma sp. P36-A1 TaxID=3252900 RepID=UPI003C2EF272